MLAFLAGLAVLDVEVELDAVGLELDVVAGEARQLLGAALAELGLDVQGLVLASSSAVGLVLVGLAIGRQLLGGDVEPVVAILGADAVGLDVVAALAGQALVALAFLGASSTWWPSRGSWTSTSRG